MFDTVIRGGTIVDGTGAAPFTGDVAHPTTAASSPSATVDGPRREEIDADGALVTPGLPRPPHPLRRPGHVGRRASSRRPPTASRPIVLGNCGVGFAPVRPADHEQLIDMMEGVEDIPGAALTDGMPWGEWETFAEYLDVIDRRRYAANVACHIAHGPVRYYVMGERAYDDHDATPDEVARDGPHRRGGVRRRRGRLLEQPLPGPHVAVGQGRARHVRAGRRARRDRRRRRARPATACSRRSPTARSPRAPRPTRCPSSTCSPRCRSTSGRPLTFSTFQASTQSDVFRRVLDGTAAWNAQGAQLRPQIIPRAVTFMTSLGHLPPVHEPARPTRRSPTSRSPSGRPRMRRPRCATQILGEQDEFTGGLGAMMGVMLGRAVGRLFSLAFPVDYEPDPSQSVKAQARALGRRAARLPLRPHDRGRRHHVLRPARQQLRRRHARAVPRDAARPELGQRALRRRRPRDDDLGLQRARPST